MISHIRGLSSKARLREFILSESGETDAQKAARMGAILATSALATLLMNVGAGQALQGDPNCVTCSDDLNCKDPNGIEIHCRYRWCQFGSLVVCAKACTAAQDDFCVP